MKIERLSENQIRCTLNESDLADKQVKLSELAYGSPRARELFRELMQQASNELGFEVENIPLMIEAIPVSSDCLILIVTKVEDPEELDTRFSRFTRDESADDEDDEYDDVYDDEDDDEDDFMSFSPGNGGMVGRIDIGINGDQSQIPEAIFEALEGFVNSLSGLAGNAADISVESNTNHSPGQKKSDETPQVMTHLIVFDSLNTVIQASKQVAGFYFSTNTLYKNPVNKRFYLLFTNDRNTAPEFDRVCYIFDEYGTSQKVSDATPYHFKEHFKTIIEDEAVQTLSAL